MTSDDVGATARVVLDALAEFRVRLQTFLSDRESFELALNVRYPASNSREVDRVLKTLARQLLIRETAPARRLQTKQNLPGEFLELTQIGGGYWLATHQIDVAELVSALPPMNESTNSPTLTITGMSENRLDEAVEILRSAGFVRSVEAAIAVRCKMRYWMPMVDARSVRVHGAFPWAEMSKSHLPELLQFSATVRRTKS